jgi:hypothetical protein
VPELQVLLQLRERLVVSGLQAQRLESMVELVPQQELMSPSFVLVQRYLVVQLALKRLTRQQLVQLSRLH